jgi:uncharacterized protein (DUF488 family)
MTLYTIGHSTRSFDEFLGILKHYGIELLGDVRSLPGSRYRPEYNQETMAPALEKEGISYRHFAALGGRRKTRTDSRNTAWRNKSFRGYADYMETEAFEAGLSELLAAASGKTTALMCAEAVPWRCHRSMIGDALLARGIDVVDIFSETKAEPETLTPFARVSGTKVSYPAPEESGG